ncbi:zinc finger protein 414 [Eudromia elegans]
MKTEKDEALPAFSMGGKYTGDGAGCSDPAVSGGPVPVPGGGGAQAQDLRPLKRRPVPGKHYQCSSYGCKLAFHSMQELMDHLKVHYRPTQSLEGKTFRCPTLGCSETFPSMQDLMAHMKVHYKPNRYFKCENCLLRFRTHRSLFKHLHVCSDSAGSSAPAARAERPVLAATAAPGKEALAKPLEGLPKLQGAVGRVETAALLPSAEPAAPAADGLHRSTEATPLLPPAAHPFPLLEPNPFGPSSLARLSGPPHSSGPAPFVSYVHPSSYSLPQPSGQHRLRPYVPGQGLPVSNAMWKKSQGVSASPLLPCFGSGGTPGHSSAGRIVWEHTRGRYSCTQCPFGTASRDDMTLHTEEHRKPPARLQGDAEFGVGIGPFHPKLPPEMEPSLYSQL